MTTKNAILAAALTWGLTLALASAQTPPKPQAKPAPSAAKPAAKPAQPAQAKPAQPAQAKPAKPAAPARPPAQAAPASRSVLPQTQRPLHLIVTITLATGKAETFAREIDRMEIIQDRDGHVRMVHLVLVTGGERNTHIWYNYGQVSKLSYRFVTAEGRSKVYVRLLRASPATRELTDRLAPLSPREFR